MPLWLWEKMVRLIRCPIGFFILLIVFFAGCATEPEIYIYEKGTSIAVWDLENFSPVSGASPDLGGLLSTRVIETLRKIEGFNVVEREHFADVLEELNLGTMDLVDESTRLRLGKLVGAKLMIFGGYQVIADHMRLDLRLVEVRTGKIISASGKIVEAGDLEGWLKAAEEATMEMF